MLLVGVSEPRAGGGGRRRGGEPQQVTGSLQLKVQRVRPHDRTYLTMRAESLVLGFFPTNCSYIKLLIEI